MPHYFFHVRRQDDSDPDAEGTSFDSLEAAKTDACNTLRELVAEELLAGRRSTLTAIEILDSKGNVLADISIDEAVIRPLR